MTQAKAALPRSPVERLAAVLNGAKTASLNWVELIETANRQLVTPSLSAAVHRTVAGTEYRDEMVYLEQFASANCERNAHIWAELESVCEALARIGIEPTLLKGVALLAGLDNPADADRMLTDIDILVPPSNSVKAVEMLTASGYETVEGPSAEHSVGNLWREGSAATIDLHVSLPDSINKVLADTDLQAGSSIKAIGAAKVRIPSATANLIINVAHEFLHDRNLLRGDTTLRYLIDITRHVDVHRDELDYELLNYALKGKGFALGYELQSRMATHLFGSAPLPGSRRTLAGYVLHARRIAKLRYPVIDRSERLLKSFAMWAFPET